MDNNTKRHADFLINTAYVAVVAAIVYLAFKYVAGWVLPFIVAFCLVSVIHPLVNRAVNTLGVKKEVISIIIMVLIYVVIGILVFLLILQAVFMVRNGLALLPKYYVTSIKPSFDAANETFKSFMQDLPRSVQEQAEIFQRDLINTIQNFLIGLSQKGIAWISSLTGRIPAFMIAFVFTIMLSFFLSVQYDKVIGFIKTQLPPRASKIATDTKVIIIDTVFKYLRAALTLMCVTFTELSIGLLVLGKSNAIPIAAGISIFDALPFFGTGGIIVPWAIIELVQGNYSFAIGLLIIYGIVVVVRSFIEPKIVGDKLGLNPIVSLVSIYLGFKVIGVLGMIAMPITTQIILELHRKGSIKLFRDKIKQDVEHDPVPDTEQP